MIRPLLFLLLLGSLTGLAKADDFEVDKVYHPYVLPNEREIEWRVTSRQNDNGNLLSHRIALGHALSERITTEFYIVAERDNQGDFGLQGYELETRWMLTEQGQYWADWGLLFELEKQHDRDNWEFSTGVLFEKELGRTSLTLNGFITAEWGKDTESEMSAQFRMQYRYRWIPQLQPAIEIYTGDDYTGVGPAFMGIQRFDGQRQLKWEFAFIAGLNGENKDHTLRMAMEFEF